MRRAIALELLEAALGRQRHLPSPEELRELLARAEVSLFTGGLEIDPALLDAAWFLHAVASARPDLNVYDLPRRRRAHQVSAHIFDVYLQSELVDAMDERLRYTFAAQVGYIGSELSPNASAMAVRIDFELESVALHPGIVALQAGVLLLALDRRGLVRAIAQWRNQLDELSNTWVDISSSPFAAVNSAVRGVDELLQFLRSGTGAHLDAAQSWFVLGINASSSRDDADSRWVCAHLLNLSGDLETASVWRAVPPNEFPGVARAMSLADPPVLTLWPPQLRFLEHGEGSSPLSRETKRLLLSFPTSAGKTLLAQLVILAHLATGEGGVCVVAPTHSLSREIQRGLYSRLSILGTQSFDAGPEGSSIRIPARARAVVMTPERLSGLLRIDAASVLERFSLFVIDEAHLVIDGDRGWRLESLVSTLQSLTTNSDHRIAVLSAAMGQKAHIVAWIGQDDRVFQKHEEWRAPRRLHALFNSIEDTESAEVMATHGRRLARRRVPLKGQVYLRTDAGRAIRSVFKQPIGIRVRRMQRNGEWTIDTNESTTQRAQLVPLIQHVAGIGPTLVVEPTRSMASKLADEVARDLDDYPAATPLADLAALRLGEGHPLVRVLHKGVAFHHGALPPDIQAEIEDAVRLRRIKILVATNTVTEGVNLPFKTVIVGSTGYGGGDNWVELIDPARLMNAFGRAGRSGRETEGWLILADHRDFQMDHFQPLELSAEDLELTSTLVQQAGVEALARFEVRGAESVDAVFEEAAGPVAGFCAYIWFLAEALDEVHGSVSNEDVLKAMQTTLAWQQADDALKARWSAVAQLSLRAYRDQDSAVRRRWARSGTSLSTSRTLQEIAEEIVATVQVEGLPDTVDATLAMLLGSGRFKRLLGMPENRRQGFKIRRGAPAGDFIEVDVLGLLRAWVSGQDLEALSAAYLYEIPDGDYRAEQLSEFVSAVFEHFLPWTLSVVIEWINERLERIGGVNAIPDSLPRHVHFGLPTLDALKIAEGGVRSRRIAVVASEAFQQSESEDVVDWLAEAGVPAWRANLGASATELSDLLWLVRAPGAQLLSRFLAGEAVAIPFQRESGTEALAAGASMEIADAVSEMDPLPVSHEGRLVGYISAGYHQETRQLLDLAMPFVASVYPDDPGQIRVQLSGATDR